MKSLLIIALFLTGCATSSYNQGCRDALENAFTGDYTEWHGPFCDKLEAKYKEELRQRQERNMNRGKP